MTSIIYIGLDVHSTNYTICAYDAEKQRNVSEATIQPSIKELERYLINLNKRLGGGCHFVCGYEAGCLGHSLYKEIMLAKWEGFDAECIILAPTTIPTSGKEKKLKTDKRDARRIAQCLANNTYSSVYVTTDEDDAVKEYIRMRDDAQQMLKQTKQQINAFCLRQGYNYDGTKSKWTVTHIVWLDKLDMGNAVLNEVLKEYMATYRQLQDKVDRLDKRIKEFAQGERYAQNVSKLGCFKGIATHTALSLLVEIGDFRRFPNAQSFSAFLGLVPSEYSSGNSRISGAITKAGNTHLRRLLVESASTYAHGEVGKKTKVLQERQYGNEAAVIAYADKGTARLRRRYISMIKNGKRGNVAKTAIARELACFVWGMMTGHIN